MTKEDAIFEELKLTYSFHDHRNRYLSTSL